MLINVYITVKPNIGTSLDAIASVMNSSITFLIIETIGRVALGDGALEIAVEDANEYLLIPNIYQNDNTKIKEAFVSLLSRPILNVFEEVKFRDRQELDKAVLEAMGLKPEEWLHRIYDGLTTLTRERAELR